MKASLIAAPVELISVSARGDNVPRDEKMQRERSRAVWSRWHASARPDSVGSRCKVTADRHVGYESTVAKRIGLCKRAYPRNVFGLGGMDWHGPPLDGHQHQIHVQ